MGSCEETSLLTKPEYPPRKLDLTLIILPGKPEHPAREATGEFDGGIASSEHDHSCLHVAIYGSGQVEGRRHKALIVHAWIDTQRLMRIEDQYGQLKRHNV